MARSKKTLKANPGTKALDDAPAISLAPVRYCDVRSYDYGARVNEDSLQALEVQFALAHDMYNDLVQVMRATFTKASKLVMDKAGAEAVALAASIEALEKNFAAAKGNNDRDAMRTIARQRGEAKRQLIPLLIEARRHAKDELKEIYSNIGQNKRCQTYAVRCEYVNNGLGWATANAILEHALKAWRTNIKNGRPPQFKRAQDRIQIVVSLQFSSFPGGISADKLLRGESAELILSAPGEGHGRRKYAGFQFRLGAAKSGVYAVGTWQYHRSFPEGASITAVRLIRRRIGKDFRYTLQFQVKSSEHQSARRVRHQPKLVAVHIGWAAGETGRHVAGIADGRDLAAAKVLILPSDIESDFNRASRIQGRRDAAREAVVAVVRSLDKTYMSASLADKYDEIRQLTTEQMNFGRLHRFIDELLNDGYPLERMERLLVWRREDRSLFQDSSHIALTARNRRRDFYKKFAAQLAANYDAIALEPVDLKETLTKVDTTTGEYSDFGPRERAGQVVAAVSELDNAIRSAAEKHDVPVIEVTGYTIRCCAHCGGATYRPAPSNVEIICTSCGSRLDRKKNGAVQAWALVEPRLAELCDQYKIKRAQAEAEYFVGRSEVLTKRVSGRAKLQDTGGVT